MMKCSFKSLCFMTLTFIVATNGECEPCVLKEECSLFGDMTQQQQRMWLESHSCQVPVKARNILGFASVAKGDYVCCSESMLDFKNGDMVKGPELNKNSYYIKNHHPGISYNPDNYRVNSNSYWHSGYARIPNNYDSDLNNANYGIQMPVPQRIPTTGAPYFQDSNSFMPNLREQCSAQLTSFPPNPDSMCCGREVSDTDKTIGSTPNFNQNRPVQAYTNQENWAPRPNVGQSYMFIPLGMNKERISDPELLERSKRSPQNADNNVTVTIDTRIAGGKGTEFYQYPWTVYLIITFDYGNEQGSFSCGGSLISAQYVLTAGHCLHDPKGKVTSVKVHLAEYDKLSFPRDCRNVVDKGQICIENMIIYAENIIIHAEYDDDRLNNDIALLRLHTKAPYTDYIRPICLPFIDIDDPKYSNLPLFVAGWGKNGDHESNIKQSTVVNLVPQRECSKSYADLTRRHLCAAGYRGQDTCKGDSGGPLMVLYKDKYYVAGIVSGKRADSPCGTSVPSLYTNVYHYLEWIKQNIRN